MLGFIFIVWDLLAMRPVFLPTKLHENENLKEETRGEADVGVTDLVRGEKFESAGRICYHITLGAGVQTGGGVTEPEYIKC